MNVDLIAFGTFGTPHGFRQSSFLRNPHFLKLKTFDLNTNAIKLFPGNTVYSIRKEHVGGLNAIAYSVYSYAKERTSDRGGTFIGSSLLFYEKIAEEGLTVRCLREFHNDVMKDNVIGDIIQVSHSDKLVAKKPANFDKMGVGLKDIAGDLNFTESTQQSLVVYSEVTPESKLTELFRKSAELLGLYDTVFFTASVETGQFVREKQLFKIVDYKGFIREIESYRIHKEEERKRKIREGIEKLERERTQLTEARTRYETRSRSQMEENEKQHTENRRQMDAAGLQHEKVSRQFGESLRQIGEAILQIREESKSPEEAADIIEENRRQLEAAHGKAIPHLIRNLSHPDRGRDAFYPEKKNQPLQKETFLSRINLPIHPEVYKALALLFFVLWLFTLLFFLLSGDKKETVKVPVKITQPLPVVTVLPDLNPRPNAELDKKAWQKLTRKLKVNTKINEVVKTIFDANPRDIRDTYSTQTDLYARHLVKLNPGCFEKRGNDVYFVGDTLRRVMVFRR